MNDEADLANDHLQHIIDTALANAANKAKTPVNTTGHCIWCEEPIKSEQRWCSVECRNDYEKVYK